MIKCAKCGYENAAAATNCANCRVNLQWAAQHLSTEPEWSGAEGAEPEAGLITARDELVITTTFSIEGRVITEYLGLLAVEVVHDSHYEFRKGKGITDAIGITSEIFRSVFSDVREAALDELREQALDLGADAVVGASLDYLPVSSSLVMVAIRGTAVKLSAETAFFDFQLAGSES